MSANGLHRVFANCSGTEALPAIAQAQLGIPTMPGLRSEAARTEDAML